MTYLSRGVEGAARILAYIGGIALLCVIVMTITSVTGRALIFLGLRPIAGDFEMVEALTGIAIFCFLPICQLNRGHVVVDLFANAMGPRAVRVIDMICEMLMAIVLFVIAWRLTYGLMDKYRYGETSMIRQFPIWWAYAASITPAYVSFLTAIYTSIRAIAAVAQGRDIAPQHQVTVE